ncbi:MAG: carboxypeptidase regulatory-like domain-containing protein [Myxococcaceae bacterium]|nr:carboxypeptidase regulatory-like domain-containing protein [Myxococcaceae bacterium]
MRLFVTLALLFGGSAAAQQTSALHPDEWVHTRAFATIGANGRNTTQRFDSDVAQVAGAGRPAFFSLHLSAAHFPRQFLGFGLELRSDLVGVTRSDATDRRVFPQQTVRAAPTVALRWNPSAVVGLEAHLGWSAGRVALIRPTADGLANPIFAATTGPVVGATVTLDPMRRLSLLLSARAEYSLIELTGFTVNGFVQVRYGLLELGPFDLGVALSAEVQYGSHRGPILTQGTETLWRAGLGPSLVGRRSPPVDAGKPAGAPSVVGRVTSADGTAVVGASVTSQGHSTTTDDAGAFALEGLAPGPATVAAAAGGFKEARKDVVVTPGVPVEVALVLTRPTGPGRITGTVRAGPDKPLAGAKVTPAGKESVSTSATGAFTIESAGPGPVKVKVTLDGYAPADEVVQVAPEATATLDVTLEPVAQRARAKVRGIISSASGPVAKATVRIVELKLKQAVKADGRFELDVAGGKYTLVIEAPKHVTQTRAVEVADGDQAIFQIELEKTR